MFCGRDPAGITPTDEETRTLDVKLKLLSGFKKAKITYCPDTPPVRDIISKVRGNFSNLKLFTTETETWCDFEGICDLTPGKSFGIDSVMKLGNYLHLLIVHLNQF